MTPSLQDNPLISQWLELHADGTVTAFTGKSELGQGVATALAQIVATEFGVPLDQVRMQAPSTDRSPNEGFTAGSLSIQHSGTALQSAARAARHLLVQEASSRGVDLLAIMGELDLDIPVSSVVIPGDSEAPAGEIGRSVPRRDLDAKILGEPAFIHDMRLPGMRFCRVIRPPYRGAQLAEQPEPSGLPGDTAVIREGSFVAVVASLERHAIAASALVADRCRWVGEPPALDDQQVTAFLLSAPTDDTVLAEGTGHDAELPGDSATLTARYTRPFVAHASIGTACAIALWTADHLEVWSHTQGVYPLRKDIARALGIDAERVMVHHVEGSGCYGHNPADDVAYDAALAARHLPGVPVQVTWSREDELSWSPMAPAMCVDISTTTDSSGQITSWRWDGYGNGHSSRPSTLPTPSLLAYASQTDGTAIPPSQDPPLAAGQGTGRNALPAYDIPDLRAVAHRLTTMPMRASAMRSLGAYTNVFAIESHIDDLARAHGIDPVEYRLRHLSDARSRRVIEVVAELAGWGDVAGENNGRGIGFARYKNTGAWCAVIADVEAVDQVTVKHLWIAVDCGRVVNPDGVRNQIEGGAIQSASWTLMEQVTFAAGAVTSSDWESYPIMRFPSVPAVTTTIVSAPDEPWLGSGEAASGPTAAALGNALRHALGVRVRTLPLSAEHIVAAMAEE